MTIDSDFHQLIDQHAAMISRIVASYEADQGLRQDLVQDIWLKIWRGIKRYRGDGDIKAYTARIARNHCISHVVKMVSRPKAQDLDENFIAPTDLPDEALDKRQKKQRLEHLIRQLPLEQREVLVLALEGFSHKDIASALGIQENAVATRASRAKAKLKRSWS